MGTLGSYPVVKVGEFLLVDPVTWHQFMGKDTLAQTFRHFLIKGGRGNSGHILGVVIADKPVLCRLASIIMDTVLCGAWYVKLGPKA